MRYIPVVPWPPDSDANFPVASDIEAHYYRITANSGVPYTLSLKQSYKYNCSIAFGNINQKFI